MIALFLVFFERILSSETSLLSKNSGLSSEFCSKLDWGLASIDHGSCIIMPHVPRSVVSQIPLSERNALL